MDYIGYEEFTRRKIVWRLWKWIGTRGITPHQMIRLPLGFMWQVKPFERVKLIGIQKD